MRVNFTHLPTNREREKKGRRKRARMVPQYIQTLSLSVMKDDWVSKMWKCGCGALNAGWLDLCGRCKAPNSKLPPPPPASPCAGHDAESERNIDHEMSEIDEYLYKRDDR